MNNLFDYAKLAVKCLFFKKADKICMIFWTKLTKPKFYYIISHKKYNTFPVYPTSKM